MRDDQAMGFKFEIGDLVQSVGQIKAAKLSRDGGDPQVHQVLERIWQQCPGGVQRHYVIRSHASGFARGAVSSDDCIRVLEIELVPIPDQSETTTEATT